MQPRAGAGLVAGGGEGFPGGGGEVEQPGAEGVGVGSVGGGADALERDRELVQPVRRAGGQAAVDGAAGRVGAQDRGQAWRQAGQGAAPQHADPHHCIGRGADQEVLVGREQPEQRAPRQIVAAAVDQVADRATDDQVEFELVVAVRGLARRHGVVAPQRPVLAPQSAQHLAHPGTMVTG